MKQSIEKATEQHCSIRNNELIEKYSTIIADFMGWKTHPKYGKGYVQNLNKNRKLPFRATFNYEAKLDELVYHESFDYLMPVWFKFIRSDFKYLNGSQLKIIGEYCNNVSKLLTSLEYNINEKNIIYEVFTVLGKAIEYINSIKYESKFNTTQ